MVWYPMRAILGNARWTTFLCGTRDVYCFWYLKKIIFHPNYNHSQSGKIWSEEEIFVGYNSDTCGAIILQLCHKGVPQDDVSTQQNIFSLWKFSTMLYYTSVKWNCQGIGQIGSTLFHLMKSYINLAWKNQ